MQYLTVGDVLRLHVFATGVEDDETVPVPIFDFGLLEAAVMRPQQSFEGRDLYPDVHAKAAALMHSLCRNHPFLDGNKRTAGMASSVFYLLNGWRLDMTQDEFISLAVDVASGLLDVDAIVGRLKSHVTTREDPEDEDEEAHE